jgi:hypothetical protein
MHSNDTLKYYCENGYVLFDSLVDVENKSDSEIRDFFNKIIYKLLDNINNGIIYLLDDESNFCYFN